MILEKRENGWYLDFEPNPKRKPRFRKTFKSRAKAMEFYAAMMEQYSEPEAWEKEQKLKEDNRTLSEFIEIWFRKWGNSLRDGERRYSKLLAICSKMGNPIAREISRQSFADYIEERQKEKIKDKPISNATVNRDHSYARAMVNKLKEKGYWLWDNPFAKLEMLEEVDAELTYYDEDEIKTLFKFLKQSDSDSVELVADICLSTGARWGEANFLKKRQIKNNAIQFTETKNGKIRVVPISERLAQKIKDHKTFGVNRLFSDCLSAFRRVIEKSGLESPKGQLTHVLRHSFAVNFIQNGGNINDLQLTLGHQDITTTARYLRFAPKHLVSVPKLNPMTVIYGE